MLEQFKWGLMALLVIILSINVSAVVDLKIDGAKCMNSSGVEFKITNSGDDPVATDNLKVFSTFFSAASVKVDERGTDKSYKFPIKGNFSSDIIPSKEDQLLPVKFTSQDKTLTYPAKYKIYLQYTGCKESYGECVEISEVTCQGLQEYGCKAIPITIDSCKNTDTEVLIKFHNVNKGLFMKVNPLKDLRYVFFGKRYHIQNDIPNETTVKEIDDDLYLLKFKQISGNNIERIKIFTNICGYEDYADCEFTEFNETFNETRPIISPLNESFNLTSEKEKSSTDNIIYIISLIFVLIVLFIIYNIKKVRI